VTLAADLLDQADHLAARERGRPKQASLRRAISSAYYSLFHLIVEDASRYLVAGSRLRAAVARSFEHQALRAAATALGDVSRRPTGTHWFRPHVNDPISPDLTFICDAFVDLQEQRHRADYDTGASFTRMEASGVVVMARRAHSLWPPQRSTHNAHAFILASAKLLRAR
jgi:hypothetical protein